ncbi:MAG TPA: hypothetical protein VHD57_09875 [Vicinamibacterales bacterium]|nr:hypothetical protein [Vicinamibacterales bacterium]
MADAAPAASQLRCPYCRSARVATNPKRPASSYCRCETCGQLWHPDRVRLNGGSGRDRP